MEVILLERAHNLGNVGDLVKVKNGYARNYLLPQKKALRATEENRNEFEARRSQIVKENNDKKKEAEIQAVKVEGQYVVLIRQAAEDGRLYGSVSARDIADTTSTTSSVEVKRGQVVQFSPIKALGIHTVKISLHPEVIVSVYVNVARSASEAEIAKKEFANPAKKPGETDVETAAEIAPEAVAEEGVKTKKKKKKATKIVDVELKDEDISEVA